MNTANRNILSVFIFLLSFFFFLAASTIKESVDLTQKNCYHCGTAEACSEGGSDYGWTGCTLTSYPPPDNCQVYGSPFCGLIIE